MAAPPEPLCSLLDWPEFVGALGDDEELAREILNAYVEEAPSYVAHAQRALSAGDFGELARAAHRHKGALATIYATEAAERARRLEDACRVRAPAVIAEAAQALERELLQLQPALRAWLRDSPR